MNEQQDPAYVPRLMVSASEELFETWDGGAFDWARIRVDDVRVAMVTQPEGVTTPRSCELGSIFFLVAYFLLMGFIL
jgi:hypothetical protein